MVTTRIQLSQAYLGDHASRTSEVLMARHYQRESANHVLGRYGREEAGTLGHQYLNLNSVIDTLVLDDLRA